MATRKGRDTPKPAPARRDNGKKDGNKPNKPGKKEQPADWLDCFAACVNSLGWEWAPLCAFLCDGDFPGGAQEFGFPPPRRPEAAGGGAVFPPDGMSPFKGCRGFHENLTAQPQTVTVTIYNPGPGVMDINIQKPDGVLDGNPITRVEEGETKTITVTIPPNRRLHGGSDGRRKLESVK
ncbi:MAG: hypothetical protein HY854_22505 [Burkholderiales bacterium]|nr:hypothetical protein [Burkholderiales bacterium]